MNYNADKPLTWYELNEQKDARIAELESAVHNLNVMVQGLHGELQDATRWIPVAERLPEYEEECVITDGLVCKNAWYGGSDDGFYYDGPLFTTTHWRPLPNAPEAGNV